jgi:hypothetical protein
MMAAFNGEIFVVKPRWSGDCFSVNVVRKLVLATDKKAPFYIALLDAKSAFDVMRKLHLLDIQPSTWKIIDNLHHDTRTCIKWKQQV